MTAHTDRAHRADRAYAAHARLCQMRFRAPRTPRIRIGTMRGGVRGSADRALRTLRGLSSEHSKARKAAMTMHADTEQLHSLTGAPQVGRGER
jgi:hypothetical protein